MGKFDEPKKPIPYGKLLFLMIVVMVAYLVLVLMSAPDSTPMCDEIVTLMLDDPEHLRLHNDYPEILNSLHVYLDENCETMDENNPMGINP